MALVILTKSPRANFFSKEFHKGWLRKIIKKDRGPKAVTASLLRGLNELGFAYKLNPKIREIGAHDTLWINESLDALGWAIHFKGKENTLIVGPNLVITPLDHKEILCDKAIDIILQPSAWTKDFMIMVKPELKDKLRIWPAGVALAETKNIGKSIDMLVYTKNNAEKKLLDRIILSLKERKLAFDIIDYGAFKQRDYFDKLERSRSLLYLSNSESQGLAIQEAWARNVPTLVFDSGYFNYKQYHYPYEKISAPYLNDQNGMFFTADNFDEIFAQFWNKLAAFAPRAYVEKNLSDRVCAERFLDIMNSI